MENEMKTREEKEMAKTEWTWTGVASGLHDKGALEEALGGYRELL